jgi:hypothetical protein
MKTEERICGALIATARPTAALFAGMAFLVLVSSSGQMPIWENVFRKETFFMFSFFGYALFILIPIRRLPSRTFRIVTTIGIILTLGSISWSREMYNGVVNELLDGRVGFKIMPFYLYIPMMIWQRNQEAANQVLNRTVDPGGSKSG